MIVVVVVLPVSRANSFVLDKLFERIQTHDVCSASRDVGSVAGLLVDSMWSPQQREVVHKSAVATRCASEQKESIAIYRLLLTDSQSQVCLGDEKE